MVFKKKMLWISEPFISVQESWILVCELMLIHSSQDFWHASENYGQTAEVPLSIHFLYLWEHFPGFSSSNHICLIRQSGLVLRSPNSLEHSYTRADVTSVDLSKVLHTIFTTLSSLHHKFEQLIQKQPKIFFEMHLWNPSLNFPNQWGIVLCVAHKYTYISGSRQPGLWRWPGGWL